MQFEETWAIVAVRFSAGEHAMVREDLARMMMNMAREDSDSIEQLRQAGIRAVQAKFPTRFGLMGRGSVVNTHDGQQTHVLL